MLWAPSRICSVSSRAGNSHSKRARLGLVRPASASLRGQRGAGGAGRDLRTLDLHPHGLPCPHHPLPGARERLGAPIRPQKCPQAPPNPWAELPAGWGAAEMMQPPNHRARSGRWDKIWDQFSEGKRLKSFNKRDGLGPARRLREGRASLLSGYFHFSSFQRCLGASPLGGGSAAGARGTAPCHQHCPDLRPEAPSPPQRLGGWARGWGGSNTSLLFC